jgi:hypothetical protein
VTGQFEENIDIKHYELEREELAEEAALNEWRSDREYVSPYKVVKGACMLLQSWRQMIEKEMAAKGETWDDVVSYVVGLGWSERELGSDEFSPKLSLDAEFDTDFGGVNGCSFTLWTKNRVYFPTSYDGAEDVASAPRNPCEEAMDHVGGG